MEFAKNGVINAGLIFFSVALLSTLILGRWFCGWGCHVVMLQDLCGWMMKKCGVRPKPFRSRLLIYVPLLMALYMFIWPPAYRWVVAPLSQTLNAKWSFVPAADPVPAWPGFSTQLTTTEFWKTFPGLMIAVPFLLVCGFGTVYFLGAKGFCTYGCPYGGFFAPLDRYAPGKIRVTDACHQCGHCTAVCTSNVRVHEEVREYGMVVDPGCMKCLDCVSVCPNEALYFGFGAPGIAKGKAKNEAPKRKYDLSWGEEVGLALVFAVSFFCFRGDMVRLPLLMTAGVASVITFMVWKLWRIVRDPNVNLHQFQFKLKRSLKPSGWMFALLTMLVIVLTLHSGAMNAVFATANSHDQKVTIPQEVIFAEQPLRMPDDMAAHADEALRLYERISRVGLGGWSLFGLPQDEIDMRMARLDSAKLDFSAAEARLRQAIERDRPTDRFIASLVWVLRAQQRIDEAMDLAESHLTAINAFDATMDAYVNSAASIGQLDRALAIAEKRLAGNPDSLNTMRWSSLMLMQLGRLEEGVAMTRRTIDVDPNNPNAYRYLAMGLADLGRTDEAIVELQKALQLQDSDPSLHALMSGLLSSVGRDAEAAAHQQRTEELMQPQLQPGVVHQH
jgi:polyferredoxin/tetratricopeptide (TPR) repeat protein